jgi:hexosaminidase
LSSSGLYLCAVKFFNVDIMTKFTIRSIYGLVVVLLVFSLQACRHDGMLEERALSVIPRPVQASPGKGHFEWKATTRITVRGDSDALYAAGTYLSTFLAPATGFDPEVVREVGGATKNVVSLRIDRDMGSPERYVLHVDSDGVEITGGDAIGVFHGVQTLRQLLPPEVESEHLVEDVPWILPAVDIEDVPTYRYRGLHLDVGRHFFSVEFIKKYIDLIALHKMNVFHWHLTEDQGWRIEIKKYPRLTEVGAYRKETLIGHGGRRPFAYDGRSYGGYYTQDEIREVVAYAAQRHVTVIPEIELPGHSQAALASYPELGCTGGPYEVATRWGVFPEVFCAGNDHTFEFLEDVLSEVVELFPAPYIHIGGDECPKDRWKQCPACQARIRTEGLADEHELQSYFIRRIENFLLTKDRKIIGWDEILEGGLAPQATVMSWRGMEGGIAAARQHHDVIMTPGSHCYLDHYQANPENEPLAIGGFTPLEKVYSFDPMPTALSADEQQYILGAQGNVWTEYMKTSDHVEYMVFPRAIALAEILWTPEEQQDFQNFVSRLQRHFARLDVLGVHYASKLYDLQIHASPAEHGVEVSMEKTASDGEIYYTLDGTDPDLSSGVYGGALTIRETADLRAQTFVGGEAKGSPANLTINLHKAVGKKMTLVNPPAEQYSKEGVGVVVNGVFASPMRHNDGEWLGFNGADMEVTIDLGAPTEVQRVELRFFNGRGSWIYPPRAVALYVSRDTVHFQEIIEESVLEAGAGSNPVPVKLEFAPTTVRYLKIVAKNHGQIAEGSPGAGSRAWLFTDEIVVE